MDHFFLLFLKPQISGMKEEVHNLAIILQHPVAQREPL
jgi:hypothetical protein